MLYKLYARLRRTQEDVMISEWDNVDYFNSLLTNFDESDNIERFYITYVKDNKEELYSEKILPEKGKSHQLTKKPCIK